MANDVPKYIEEIIIKHMRELSPLGEYRLYSSKYLGEETLDSKLERLEKWVERYECDIKIIQGSRIIGENYVKDIKVEGIISNLIDNVIHGW